MTTVVRKLFDGYHNMFEEITDPRTRGWPLARPEVLVSILLAYIFYCCYWGPNYMKDRKPFQLTNTLIVYNTLQVLLSIYLVVAGFLSTYGNGYSYTCQPVDWSTEPLKVHKVVWMYYIAKLTELLDTVFFVLRKKNNQLTFLHIYHHFSMPIFSYFGLRYYPNGHGCLFGIMNSMVHVVMYSYYLIAGLGPKYHKYLWWKKHVTTIQLVQFALIFIHNFPPLFTSCAYPKFLNIILCTDSALFFYMFGKFYLKNYTQKEEESNIPNGKVKARIE